MMIAVEFQEVRVGDQIYNRLAFRHKWSTVRSLERLPSGEVGLVTAAYTQWGHPREGVSVMREEP